MSETASKRLLEIARMMPIHLPDNPLTDLGTGDQNSLSVELDGPPENILASLLTNETLSIGDGALRFKFPTANPKLEAILGSAQTGSQHPTETLSIALGSIQWEDPNGEAKLAPLVLVDVKLSRQNEIWNVIPIAKPTFNEAAFVMLGIERPEYDPSDPIALSRGTRQLFVFNERPAAHIILAHTAAYDNRRRIEAAAQCPSRALVTMLGGQSTRAVAGRNSPVHDELTGQLDTDQAASFGLAVNEISHVLHGPPGTGKTQTIIRIAHEAVGRQKSVLIFSRYLAPLLRVYASFNDRDMHPVAISTGTQIHLSGNECFGEDADCPLAQPRVVFSNIDGIRSLAHFQWHYDLAIVDEATSVAAAETIPILNFVDTFVLAGDRKQSAEPISSSQTPEATLFDFGTSALIPQVKLTRHYRSQHPGLISGSNMEFYNSLLRTPPSPYRRGDLGVEVHRIVGGRNVETVNEPEARELIVHFQRSLSRGLQGSIMVVALTEDQLAYIRKLATSALGTTFLHDPNIMFVVPETAQGLEADTVLISTVYSDQDKIEPNFNSANSLPHGPTPAYVNIAFSRAKKRMVVITSIDTSISTTAPIEPRETHLHRMLASLARSNAANALIEARTPLTDILEIGDFKSATWENVVLVSDDRNQPVAAIQLTGKAAKLDEESQLAQLIYSGWPVMKFSEAAIKPSHPGHRKATRELNAFLNKNRNRLSNK